MGQEEIEVWIDYVVDKVVEFVQKLIIIVDDEVLKIFVQMFELLVGKVRDGFDMLV